MEFTPRYRNLVELFYASAQEFADRPLFGTRIDGIWRWSTYASFREMVDRCRSGLAKLGVGPGDSVAAVSDNRQEWAVSAYATYSLGATYTPILPAQLEKEWVHFLRDSGSKVCFVADDGVETKVKRLRGDLLNLEHIINYNGSSNSGSSFKGLLDQGGRSISPPVIPDESAVATCIYTADAKGDPIGVMLTHLNLASNSYAIIGSGFRGLQQGDRSLAILPWAHVFGGCIELNALIALGGSIAICERPDKLFEYLREVEPTALFSVPRIWESIFSELREQVASESQLMQAIFNAGMNARAKRSRDQPLNWGDRVALMLNKRLFSPALRKRLGGRLRFASSGAAALSVKCRTFLENVDLTVFEGYGLTECSGCATASGPASYRAGSVGKPLPGMQIKLDKGVPSGNEEEGEIIVYGLGVMKGYQNQPELTRGAFTADKGLRTGDLGRIDADGFLYVTGAIKELYKLANGRYVAPAALEYKLRRSTYIAQCLVYGMNRPYNVALIVPDVVSLASWAKSHGLSPFMETLLTDARTRQLLEDEVEQCSKDFKSYERIRSFVVIDKAFTVADGLLYPSLQPNRRKIISKYEDKLEALYR
jgi:long-chain acyl-CoA synthetase